jgi:lipopolysaccharide export system permease protein
MFKNKLNNYLIFEILKSYFFVLISLSLLIWITQSARYLYLITETGLSIKIYSQYILYLMPKITSQMMLISFLISLFLSIIKFQNNKEIEIYWLSGISKKKIIFLIAKISLVPMFLAFFLYIYLSPLSGLASRNILANSEFSFVNTLVKKNNFNSPLNGITVYVSKNDNRGNLEKVYIFENNKTIIAKKGRVLNLEGKNYLQLIDGFIHEKNLQNNIEIIKFKKTLYDFTKYQTNIITTPKVQERSFAWIITEYKKNKDKEVLYEIHKRLLKPFFIPIIALLCCFILYSNNEKINLNRLKIFIFSLVSFLIIFLEILLNLSITNVFFKYFLYCFPIIGSVSIVIFLQIFFQREPLVK